MKLDLLNSRQIPLPRDYKIYDSIEGESFPKPGAKNSKYDLVSTAFNSTGPKIDYFRKNIAAPNIFDRAKIDNKGNYVEVFSQTNNKKSHPSPSKNELTPISSSSVASNNTDLLDNFHEKRSPSKQLYTPSLDIIKDKIYNPNTDTVSNRLKSGKLPGAFWSQMDRDVKEKRAFVGEENFGDKFRHEKGKYGLTQMAVKFSDIPTGRGESISGYVNKAQDDAFIPLKLKMRMERMQQINNEKDQRVYERKLKVTKHSSLPLSSSTNSLVSLASLTESGVNEETSIIQLPAVKAIKFSEASRFDSPFYKQENYVKTTGMLLDNSYDKKFDKRISNGFRQPPVHNMHKKTEKSLGSDVDVDVGHLYSTEHAVKKSPVKYSSAFRSKAAVGMVIPPTTTPAHIGPGTFTHAYPKAIVIKNPEFESLSFLRDRVFTVYQAGPEKSEKIKNFAEQHQKGPIFTKQGINSGNVHMENLVRTKMTQIYPKMAEQKFPQERVVVYKSKVKRK